MTTTQPRHRRQRQRPLLRAHHRRHGAVPEPRPHDRAVREPAQGIGIFFRKLGPAGRAVYRGVRGGTHGFLSRFTNNAALYSNLDIKYLGPIDGHDLEALEETLRLAKEYGAPAIVHVITEKGRGYEPARNDEADQFHAVGKIDPATGEPLGSSDAEAWTDVFSDALVAAGERRADVIAITAAMCGRPGCSRSRSGTPTACTTWASRSSTPWHPPPDSPSAGCTPSSRSTRRS